MKSRILELKSAESVDPLKALASDTRLKILRLLADGPLNINTLGQELGISQPNITKHVQILDQVGLITTEYTQGVQGMQKLCRLRYDRLIVAFESEQAPDDRIETVEMPIGLYTTAEPAPTCGLANAERIIGFHDEPQSFFHPERGTAGLLWMAEGFVEYVFPNTLPTSVGITWLELAMEICSEAPDYENDYPSDITVWINGVEIGMWISPGDLGGKRGRLNPAWWGEHCTQFGKLKVWGVDNEGSSVDGEAVSTVTLADLNLAPKVPIVVRIGVKPDAEHLGGFNLFGRTFGNYEQDLVLRLHYESKRKP
ncbi:MAG TPA: helix-turn-helix domain-containing protein [Armatimonadota bacterium]|jgi:predicted transcriptional regulator